LVVDFDIVDTEAPEIFLPEVIELDFPKSGETQIEVIQPKVPQPYSPLNLRPSHSLPLSQTQPQTIYLRPDGEPLPLGHVSIKYIPEEEP